MTGPLVGVIIGYLIGLKPWSNVVVVLSATYIAIGGWAIILRGVHNKLGGYSSYAPYILLAILILIAIISQIINFGKNEKKD